MECEQVRAGYRSDFMSGIAGADSANLRLRALATELSHTLRGHGAMMLAMTTAANGKACVGILYQGQRRCDRRETNGGEQDEAEETSEHEPASLVYAPVPGEQKGAGRIFGEAGEVRFLMKIVRVLAESELI